MRTESLPGPDDDNIDVTSFVADPDDECPQCGDLYVQILQIGRNGYSTRTFKCPNGHQRKERIEGLSETWLMQRKDL